MSVRLFDLLMQLALTTSVAVAFVAILRKPLRRLTGAGVSYWLWLALPATTLATLVAALLPPPALQAITPALTAPLRDVVSQSGARSVFASGTDYVLMLLSAWITGVAVMTALIAYRQRSFVRSLGDTRIDGEGSLRSDRIVAPMLVGAWFPQVWVPTDFEILYSPEDRSLMMLHERAHLERGDALANGFAMGWVCMFWFNPLMYWAVTRFRFDQELACDAWVLSRKGADKRRYANALFNAQLKSESVWQMPIGCHWQSDHPLKERIAMLKHASPNPFRRIGGASLTAVLVVAAAFTFSSGFAASSDSTTSNGPSAAKKIAIDAQDVDTREVLAMIARKSNENVLVSDKVTGKVTVHLQDVTYREALQIVAASQGLVMKQDGNITIVDVAH